MGVVVVIVTKTSLIPALVTQMKKAEVARQGVKSLQHWQHDYGL